MLFFIVMAAVLIMPPAMLAGLIVLAVQNSQKKQMIQRLRQENEMLRQELGRRQGAVVPVQGAAAPARGAVVPVQGAVVPAQGGPGQPLPIQPLPIQPAPTQPAPTQPAPTQSSPMQPEPTPSGPAGPAYATPVAASNRPAHPTAPSRPLPVRREVNWQGSAALVMGVVFVILAGAIFATTAWHLLPNAGKAALVLAFSGIFFGASAIAHHKLHITGTGRAFYILGSVFLFVAALAVGFFGLLGQVLTLWGRGRYLLLFAGTVMSETALLLGLRRYRETIYGGVCLFGITTAVMFLLASFHPGRLGFTAGMAVYGVAVAALAKLLAKRGFGNISQPIAAAFPAFSLVNLWAISALVLLNLEWGVLSGGVTLLMAGLHLYLGEAEDDGRTNTGAFALLLAAGILRAASPDDVDSWLYTGSLVLAILAGMSYMGILSGKVRKMLRYAGLCAAALLLAGNALAFFTGTEVTLAGLICMGLLLLDATLLALEYRSGLIYSLYSVMLAAFVNYLLFYLDLDIEIYCFLSSLMFAFLFMAVRLLRTPFKTLAGDIMFVLVMALDAGMLLLMLLFGGCKMDVYMLAAGSVVILTAMLALWSREYKMIRYILPVVPSALPLLIVRIMKWQYGVEPHYEMSLMIFLLLLIVWDVLRKDRFCAGILVLGTWYGAVFYLFKVNSLPFLPVLAAYLAVRHRNLPLKQRAVSWCGVCIYLIGGEYAAYASSLEPEVARQLAAAAVLGVLFLIWRKRGRELPMEIFFQAGFTVLSLTVAGAFCTDTAGVSLWYLLPVVLLCAAAYLYSYLKGRLNLHFLTAALTLALPAAVWYQYDLTENQFYGAVMVAFAATAVTARVKCPLVRFTGEDGKRLQADWYHILIVLVLLPMTLAASDERWRTVYTLLMAAYVMQFITVRPMARGALTLAEVICVAAFWIQPWIQWPDIVRLEICLIPAVAVIWTLGKIWGNARAVREIRFVLYTLCLLTLAVDAYLTRKVADALILEGICLAVFTVSCIRKCRRPAAVSAATALAVVIYMTRAFWLSLSWWVYLLAAGIGLILFAAVNEMKKHEQ